VDLYSAFIAGSHSRCSGTDHTVLLANYTVPMALPHKSSPDGATIDLYDRHLIAAYYYSFVIPKRK